MHKLDCLSKNLILVFLISVILIGFSPACNVAPLSPTLNPSTTTAPDAETSTVPSSMPAPANTNLASARVSGVIDGDTIEVSFSDRTYTVRYIGINTPEIEGPYQSAEYYGMEASAKNKELVLDRTVRLEKDVSETDKYGRLLRYVYVGELFINAELVRLGYAQAITYPPDVKYQRLFLELQDEARKAGRGLWAVTPE